MSCRHLTRYAGPASLWRRTFCGECRKARKADSLIAFALLCRKAEAVPLEGLKSTLAALDLPYSVPRPRLQRFSLFVRRVRRPAAVIAGGTLALGFAWTRYIDIDPKIAVPCPVMHRPNAFDSFNRAADLYRDDVTVGKVLDQIKKRKENAIKSSQQQRPAIAAQPGMPATMMSGGMMGGMPVQQGQAVAPANQEHEYTLDEREELVRANKPALDALREGLAREYLAPPIRSRNSLVPYLAKDRALARLLALEAQVDAERDKVAEAAQAALDAIALGIKIQQSAPINGKLVGVACEAIGRSTLWDLISRLSPAEANAAASRLETIQSGKTSTADAFVEEKWCLTAGTLELMRAPGWRTSMSTVFGSDNVAVDWAMYLTSLPYSKSRIINAVNAHMDKVIAKASAPYAGPVPEDLPEDRPVPKLMENLLPEFNQIRFMDLKDDAENRLLTIALALQAYRLEYGKYPATLASLHPVRLKPALADPFANLPLRYRPQGKSYLLWSVGPDGSDQGGMAIRSTQSQESNKTMVLSDSYGDIVAGVNKN
jgi:hypothetical protein